jgi:hypothetical protein
MTASTFPGQQFVRFLDASVRKSRLVRLLVHVPETDSQLAGHMDGIGVNQELRL